MNAIGHYETVLSNQSDLRFEYQNCICVVFKPLKHRCALLKTLGRLEDTDIIMVRAVTI